MREEKRLLREQANLQQETISVQRELITRQHEQITLLERGLSVQQGQMTQLAQQVRWLQERLAKGNYPGAQATGKGLPAKTAARAASIV